METILSYYSDRFRILEGTFFDIFSNFYDGDLSLIDIWLDAHFDTEVLKDNVRSTEFRVQGNVYFATKKLLKSWKYYTRSLCRALPASKQFSLAAANRSAVTFEMQEYQECINDIELCLNSDYPAELKPKVLMRKVECLYELGEKEELDVFIDNTLEYFKKEKFNDIDKHIKRLNTLKGMPKKKKPINEKENKYLIPEPQDGENENFAFASRKIKLSYDKKRGRHVMAKSDIMTGDILFVEKAFTFAPVFEKYEEFYLFKCYYCLKDIISGIPCQKCVLCIYCDDKCLISSWDESHRWECHGMRANIWYDLGIAFPAFKAMLKGVGSGFAQLNASYEEDVMKYGDKINNYPYVDRLVTNFFNNKNAIPYLVMATMVIQYLKKYTDFFQWLAKHPKSPKEDVNILTRHIGAILTKLISQIATNSSIIEHWTLSSSDILFPDTLISTACGIFPSVSMMNHSCKPNVSNFFVCDTIVVKALENIKEGQEIFNCYGIDFRTMNREQRQGACKTLYHFECECQICSDPLLEVALMDSYLCPLCKGRLPETESTISTCLDCGTRYSLERFRNYLEGMNKFNNMPESIEVLSKCLRLKEKLLFKFHKDFEELYYKLYNLYLDANCPENMLKYFQMWLQNEKARKGQNARSIGTKLYEAALAILHCLQTNTYSNRANLKQFLLNVENMIIEAKRIQNLYYPPYVTEKLSRKVNFNNPSPFK